MKKEFSSSDYKNLKALVYISCLPAGTTEQTVHKIFSQWVKIRSLEISRYKNPPYHCRGYAVLECDSPKEAKSLISRKTISYENVFIKVGEFYDNDKISEVTRGLKIRRIFIKNLPVNCSDDMLNQFFSSFGELEKAYCVKKKKKRFKFGYVIFKNVNSISKIAPNDLRFYDGTVLKWKWTGKTQNVERAGEDQNQSSTELNRNQQVKGRSCRNLQGGRDGQPRRTNKRSRKRGRGGQDREMISPNHPSVYQGGPVYPFNLPQTEYFTPRNPRRGHQDTLRRQQDRPYQVSYPEISPPSRDRNTLRSNQALSWPIQGPGGLNYHQQRDRRIRPRLFQDMEEDQEKPTFKIWYQLNFNKLTKHFFETDGGKNYRFNKLSKKKSGQLKKLKRKSRKNSKKTNQLSSQF